MRRDHETDNWRTLADFSNGFNAVNRIAVLAEVAPFVWGFSPDGVKCYANGWRAILDGCKRSPDDRSFHKGAERGPCPAYRCERG